MGPKPCVFARNCSIQRLDKQRAAEFLTQHHALGACKARYHYGIFVERTSGKNELALPQGTLVAVGSFSNARRFQNGHRSFEWMRYCSLSELRVVGGLSLVLCQFRREHSPDDVMTYIDLSCSDGESFIKLGFEKEEIVERNGFKNLKLKKYF